MVIVPARPNAEDSRRGHRGQQNLADPDPEREIEMLDGGLGR
jgi:hypothetical protein